MIIENKMKMVIVLLFVMIVLVACSSITEQDKEIYYHVEDLTVKYSAIYDDVTMVEDISFILTAQEFNVSIVEAFTSYRFYMNHLYGFESDLNRNETIDMFEKLLLDTGFSMQNGEWYYQGYKIKDIKVDQNGRITS